MWRHARQGPSASHRFDLLLHPSEGRPLRMNAPLPADLPEAATAALLHVEGLGVAIARTDGEEVRPVDGVDFAIAAGETFALLGESGCGKSMTALALARLLPDGGRIAAGSVRLGGEDLLALPEAAMRRVRGGRIGMIFQEPSTSLNPVMSVGAQIAEALAAHGLRGEAARAEACRLLAAVGIPDPERRLQEFPFQFSGGMKQRVMIAIALAGRPRLLIADEPTTALDVTIQAQVLDLLAALQRREGMAMLLITHDLGVVARVAHRVGVMYAGQVVETGPRAAFFATPLHPYSRKLFAALSEAAKRGGPLDAPVGSVPPPDRHFPGCRFAERCPAAFDRCDEEAPAWHAVGVQAVRCHLYEGVAVPRQLVATLAGAVDTGGWSAAAAWRCAARPGRPPRCLTRRHGTPAAGQGASLGRLSAAALAARGPLQAGATAVRCARWPGAAPGGWCERG